MQTETEARTSGKQPRKTRANQADIYDFTRPDRIPQSQIRAIQIVFENAARSLSSSLSAHLGAYVTVNPVSLAQTSYREFIQAMPSPSVMATVGLKPHDGLGVLDLTPELVFPVLEMLLGRRSRFGRPVEREVTDVELRLLEGVFRIVLQDLRETWKAVGPMEFKLQAINKEPQFVQALAPSEAVLAVTISVQVGDTEAGMHMALPSQAISRMRQNAGPQWKAATSAQTLDDQEHTLSLIEMADTEIEVQMCPSHIRLQDLVDLNEGDLLMTDHPTHRSFRASVNGRPTMTGDMVRVGRKLAFQVSDFIERSTEERAERGAEQ